MPIAIENDIEVIWLTPNEILDLDILATELVPLRTAWSVGKRKPDRYR